MLQMLFQVDYTLFLSGELAGADSPVSDVMLTIGIDQLGVMNSYVRWLAVGTVDHVVAKARGGTNDRTNKVMACAKCNTKKANKRTHRIKTLARLNVLRALAGAPPLTEFS